MCVYMSASVACYCLIIPHCELIKSKYISRHEHCVKRAAVPPVIINGRLFKMTAQRRGVLISLTTCCFPSSLLGSSARIACGRD